MAHHSSCPIKETDTPCDPIKPYRNVASDRRRARDSGPPAGGHRHRPVANEKCPGRVHREGSRAENGAGELMIYHTLFEKTKIREYARKSSAIRARFKQRQISTWSIFIILSNYILFIVYLMHIRF